MEVDPQAGKVVKLMRVRGRKEKWVHQVVAYLLKFVYDKLIKAVCASYSSIVQDQVNGKLNFKFITHDLSY